MIKHCIKLQCILLEKTDLMSGCTRAAMNCLTSVSFKIKKRSLVSHKGTTYTVLKQLTTLVRWGGEGDGESMTKPGLP